MGSFEIPSWVICVYPVTLSGGSGRCRYQIAVATQRASTPPAASAQANDHLRFSIPFPTAPRTSEALGAAGSPEASSETSILPISSYLLDATNSNRLWFHQFRERNWLSLNGLLRQSIEQFAA